MNEVIAVFDIGKTNKKVLLFDSRFKVVFQQEDKFPVILDDDGFECDDINLISDWIYNTLIDIAKGDKYTLVGVNFSTYGASLMFLDNEGKPLTPVYNYLKEVSEEIAENLFSSYGGKAEFCRKTASPALGLLLNSGIQILWLKEAKSAVYEKANAILHFPQYLSYSLTKQVVSEPTSIGCHTFMWDYDNMTYHRWITDHNIQLPEPVTNDVVFPVDMFAKPMKVGTGIHDSSASLVPYLKASPKKFILISTGTWCINMNPFNTEPLTADQLEQDCLCFMTPEKQQVKSSRLFMGHFHEVWAARLAKHFGVEGDAFKTVTYCNEQFTRNQQKFGGNNVFFPNGKESFDEGLKNADLNNFESYDEAYFQLMVELTRLCIKSIELVIPAKDDTEIIYVSGGFARNDIFIRLLETEFTHKKVLVSEIDNSSALGAALVISDVFTNAQVETLDLGIK